MICYIIRHGKDDETLRGGWSSSPLTSKGIAQVESLALKLAANSKINAGMIYTSDLARARQTAEILSAALNVPIKELPEFREANNGVLAGMDNKKAEELYPGLYWNTLAWEQPYPGGESPCDFYRRISKAWYEFKSRHKGCSYDVVLVTHGGVINAIQCIENSVAYSNKTNSFPLSNAEMISIEL